MDKSLRALRGATTVPENSASAITQGTKELLSEMFARNEVAIDDLVSVIFTATADLNAEFPAAAARALGIDHVPLLCAQEIEVAGDLPRCIRVLMHLYTAADYASLRHVYLRDAKRLRTDLPE